MKRHRLAIFVTLAVFLAAVVLFAVLHSSVKLSPCLNNGNKWRIGYYEGGAFTDYPLHLRGLIRGLMKLRWIKDTPLPPPLDATDTQSIWDFVSRRINSPYIEFVGEAYWSCDWNETTRESTRTAALQYLKSGKIDLILAMGTWGGQDLACDENSVPTIVMSTTDPVRAGIVKSPYDSGRINIHASCDPDRYTRQITTFHNLVQFERLGVVYEDTPNGRIWSNIPELEKASKDLGFELVKRSTIEIGKSEQYCFENVLLCYNEIAPLVDAMWINTLRGEETANLPKLLKPMVEHKVRTWSIMGPAHVKIGALLSIAEESHDDVGRFYASTIAQIFNGRNPGELNQVFSDPKALSLNTKTAELIGFNVSDSILQIADIIYNTVEIEGFSR